MSQQVVSMKDLDDSPGAALRAAEDGPVSVREGDQPIYVVLRYEEYVRLAAKESCEVIRLGPPPTD